MSHEEKIKGPNMYVLRCRAFKYNINRYDTCTVGGWAVDAECTRINRLPATNQDFCIDHIYCVVYTICSQKGRTRGNLNFELCTMCVNESSPCAQTHILFVIKSNTYLPSPLTEAYDGYHHLDHSLARFDVMLSLCSPFPSSPSPR